MTATIATTRMMIAVMMMVAAMKKESVTARWACARTLFLPASLFSLGLYIVQEHQSRERYHLPRCVDRFKTKRFSVQVPWMLRQILGTRIRVFCQRPFERRIVGRLNIAPGRADADLAEIFWPTMTGDLWKYRGEIIHRPLTRLWNYNVL